MSYDFKAVEEEVRRLWEREQTFAKARAKVAGKPRTYFLDGPPYTSGHVHLGTAWNKSLKDMYLRYKRMCGFDAWDRAGYDMHGLPTERATERALGIFGKDAIRAYGADKFVERCKETCYANAREMSETFAFLGVWMDLAQAYRSAEREYMEGVWWFVRRAEEEGRLYEAEKTMTWDAVNATALAKHELEYHTVVDNAIYVRLPVVGGADGEFLVVWTTTPWTIPFNLAVMAGPDIDYVRVDVVHAGAPQRWVLAEARIKPFLVDELKLVEGKAPADGGFSVVWRGKGRELAGIGYVHPFARHDGVYARLKAEMPRVHTVLMSSQFVDTETGTGLVHTAPGCGPEDYVVGKENGIEPFNTVDEGGVVRDLKPVTDLKAKIDDAKFIELIAAEGALVHEGKVEHEYPFGERSHAPVIFRTTRQWFLRVEDMKQRLLEANAGINWIPQTAKNAFVGWLQNLRDNSISKQRFWGTPLPIWRSCDDPSDYVVIATADELCELAGLEKGSLPDIHPPVVDKITFERVGKDGKKHTYKRVPDILDVWVDAGSASWNCLRVPGQPEPSAEQVAEMLPAEFILEGRDQIRGWFNLLHLESMVAFGRPCFRNVYMHGFVDDAQGRKMSKTLGNYILPSEIFDRYGVDTMRFYLIGASTPGEDMSYNMSDVELRHKNLGVFWNIHTYLLVTATALADTATAVPLAQLPPETLGVEERYILSRLNACIRDVTAKFDQFKLNKVPGIIEEFLLEVSHVYIQLIWEKKDAGSPADKRAVLSTLAECIIASTAILGTFCPFIAEKMYQNIRTSGIQGLAELATAESVHLLPFPVADPARIDAQLEADVAAAKDAVTALLAARDKANLPVKQPSRAARIACPSQVVPLLQRTSDLIVARTNVKALLFEPPAASVTVAPNQKTIGKQFGRDRARIATFITEHAAQIGESFAATAAAAAWSMPTDITTAAGAAVTLTEEHLVLTRGVAKEWAAGKAGDITAYLDTTRTEALELEGNVRELARKIQLLRKKGGLQRGERARVEIVVPSSSPALAAAARENAAFLRDRTGSAELTVADTTEDPAAAFASRQDCRVSSVEKVASTSVALAIFP